MKKSPLTEKEQKEVELFQSLSYYELVEYVNKRNLVEVKEQPIRELDMTLEEFLETYDAVDLSKYFQGINKK